MLTEPDGDQTPDSDVRDGSIIISSIIFIIYNLFTHTPVKLVRMCGGVITHTHETQAPGESFIFPKVCYINR